MLTFRDLVTAFRKLDIDRTQPVMAHASLAAFGDVHGGAETLLGALLSSFNTLVMPTFTYKTMIIPEVGPLDNAIIYGSGRDTNRMAEMYRPDMPADSMMGVVAESLRKHPSAQRSSHPILSFAGVNAGEILEAQSINEPLLPFQKMIDEEGWVLLLGVDLTVNTSMHYGERLAGRKQFTRWALTSRGIVACPGFPGCSNGFEAAAPGFEKVSRKVKLDGAVIQAIPLVSVVDTVSGMIKENPLALLCDQEDCHRCNTIRAAYSLL